MNGLKAMYRIMKQNPIPILVVSDIKDSHIAFKALSIGAVDIISKSDLSMEKQNHFGARRKDIFSIWHGKISYKLRKN